MSTLKPTRREFMKSALALTGALAIGRSELSADTRRDARPNVLFIMTDQQRADTIAALGNPDTYTPNFNRLVRRGVAFTRAYSTCPVCVPARYTVRTGCEPPTTGVFMNGRPRLADGQAPEMEDRCGKFIARAMSSLGYRTFGVGKFHAYTPAAELGYDEQMESNELYRGPDDRTMDAYASFIAKEHPEFDWIEQLMGERTEMYYMPQMRPMPKEIAQESWAADRAVEQIRKSDNRPYFGFVSFIGPHPPIAPPMPFNRMYDPDRMPNPVRGDIEIDHMDEQITWMNHAIFAEDINDSHARVLKARYYGTVSYIDWCLGRILDAVEARPDADNTLICFFSDHGDHLGDHSAWQKESFYEESCRVPFLVSWPKRLAANTRREELVCLTDLFGIATSAAGHIDRREGIDVLRMLEGASAPRERLFGYYGAPGTPLFKIMVREGDWKYIYMANGGREQLFNLAEDPQELRQRMQDQPAMARRLREAAVRALSTPSGSRALENGDLRSFPFEPRKLERIYQFDRSRGVNGFPEHPADVLKELK